MEIFRRSFRHQKFSTGKFVGASSLGILTHSGHLFYILEPLWKTDLSWTPLSTTSETLSYSTDAYQIINWSWRFTQVVMHLCPGDQESYYPLIPTGTAAQMNILKNSISLQRKEQPDFDPLNLLWQPSYMWRQETSRAFALFQNLFLKCPLPLQLLRTSRHYVSLEKGRIFHEFTWFFAINTSE